MSEYKVNPPNPKGTNPPIKEIQLQNSEVYFDVYTDKDLIEINARLQGKTIKLTNNEALQLLTLLEKTVKCI